MHNPRSEALEAPCDLSQDHRDGLGPFVVAAETTRMPMIFTDATRTANPLIFANDSFLELTGYARAAIMGRPIGEIIESANDRGTRSAILSALISGTEGTWELECQGQDGLEFLAAVFISPVRDVDGALVQNFLSFVEIGGHIGRLLEKRDELHALYCQAPGFIAIASGPEHRFTFVNASYERFVGREGLTGLTVAEALPEIAAQGFVAILDSVFSTGEPFIASDMNFDLPDSTTGEIEQRYANFVYQPVKSADGTVTGIFCEGFDVTAQHRIADHLAALQTEIIHVSRANAMGTMAVTLAHELNQPLSAIATYAVGARRLVDPANRDAEALTKALEAIAQASHRAGDIIRNLQDLTTRRTKGRTSFDLRAAVGECVRLVEPLAGQSVEIANRTPKGLMLNADRIQIQQVVINLVRNACEAVEEAAERRVEIDASGDDRQLTLCVSDSGSGVSREAAGSLFSFTDSTKRGGMGIGLSICRTIIDAHGGKLWLDRSSRAGSTFCLTLPLRPSEVLETS